jgi:hypothetical protein
MFQAIGPFAPGYLPFTPHTLSEPPASLTSYKTVAHWRSPRLSLAMPTAAPQDFTTTAAHSIGATNVLRTVSSEDVVMATIEREMLHAPDWISEEDGVEVWRLP